MSKKEDARKCWKLATNKLDSAMTAWEWERTVKQQQIALDHLEAAIEQQQSAEAYKHDILARFTTNIVPAMMQPPHPWAAFITNKHPEKEKINPKFQQQVIAYYNWGFDEKTSLQGAADKGMCCVTKVIGDSTNVNAVHLLPVNANEGNNHTDGYSWLRKFIMSSTDKYKNVILLARNLEKALTIPSSALFWLEVSQIQRKASHICKW